MKLESINIFQDMVALIKLLSTKHQSMHSSRSSPAARRSQPKYNIRAVNKYNVKRIPIPVRDFVSDPRLIVIHSFDAIKPGAEVDELKSGVPSGSVFTDVLLARQEVQIRPVKNTQGRIRCKTIFSRIVSLHAENNHLQFQLIGIGTKIEPALCRADRLVGQVLGAIEKLSRVYTGEHPGFGYAIPF
ncbi:translation protein [Suillus plorans]|uniref:Translation protein n=1 Tax=Suillus plorans TaxID=116603 RepID=A0A9P7AD77_9AGAM|nr:translation protein [Suillus plorans]KAG1787049.1 translation protein [Suillus plorans]